MKVFSLIVVIIILQASQNNLEDLEVDLNKSMVRWSGKAAFSNYTQKGTVRLDKINFRVEKNKMEELNAVANMQSLYNENEDLTNHLKSEDFFDTQRYPTASFRSIESISLHNNTNGTIKGRLRIKGFEKLVSFKYEIKYMDKEILLKIKGGFDRTDYKVNHNSPSIFKDLKDNAVSDSIVFQTDLYFKN